MSNHTRRLAIISLLLALMLVGTYVPHIVAEVRASAPEVLNGIVGPRLGYPAFIEPNGTFRAKAVLAQGAESWKAALSNEFGRSELKVESSTINQTDNTVTMELRAQRASPGLYSLELTGLTSSGTTVLQYREPISVSVRASFKLPFKVMYVTDIHVNDQPSRILNTRRIVRLANFLRPDFILSAGDNIDSATESYFPTAYSLFRDLEVPIIMAPGNHDHLATVQLFPKYFAPFYGSLDIGSVHIVTLDSGPQSIVGEIPASQLAWLRSDLAAHNQSKYKILMWHHPMFDPDNLGNPFAGDYARLGQVYGIATQYGVQLIINGHMHQDIVFHGPVLTLINSNSYEGGRPYTGFRILTITENDIEYRYAGGEAQIPLFDFDIDYTQPNDGKSYGIQVHLANNWKIAANGSLRLRVKYGDFLRVEGTNSSDTGKAPDYVILTIPVTLGQGEARKIVVYTKPDNDPPVIGQENDPRVDVGPSAIVIRFRWNISDSVMGVKSATMYYSTDNKTWASVPLVQVEPRVFWGEAQFEKSTQKIFYYAVASDVVGHADSSRTYSILALTLPPSEIPVQPLGTTEIELIAILVAVVAVATAVLYLRKRRK